MYVSSSESSRSGFRPRNNLSSARNPHFSSQGPITPPLGFGGPHQDNQVRRKQSEEDIDHRIPQNRQSLSPTFVFGGQSGQTLSELGDSSSLFSFRSPDSTIVYGVGTSAPYQIGKSNLGTASSLHQPINNQRISVPDRLRLSPPETNSGGKCTMVVEREPPKLPLSPPKPIQQSSQKPGQPEFGRASTLQSPLRTSVFNIPNQNQARPEHHRTKPPIVASKTSQTITREDVIIQPFHDQAVRKPEVVRASTANPESVVILRPANPPSWSSYSTHPATYSSLTSSLGTFASVNKPTTGQLGNYVDLTDTALFENKFGYTEPYDYIDVGKATENIKALLEGAFEDDEDKLKTRGRKKKLQEQATELATKLEGLNVRGGPKSDAAEYEEEEEEDADDGTVEGLKVKLLPHQVDGVEWMKEKEVVVKKKNGVLPKGGILADDMGLGKTIQSIALILINARPPISSAVESKHEKQMLSHAVGKGTLVVAPLALIKQWEAEISNRVASSHKLRVCVHHGPQRTKRFEDLRKYDVVITTYQILVSEHGNSADTENGLQVGCFGIHWYRVILDEAHTIKNRNAKATQACYALRAEYRWCLTGTPMQNNLDELQSLIKFLRIKPYNELSVWRDQITRPMTNGRGGVAMKRLQFYLKAFMKRRTKDVLKAAGALNPGGKATIEGKPNNGFKITERKIEKVVATFTDKERKFYERLEQRTDRSLEQMMGGSKLSYASALVLLLRLRQACNHPELVGGSMAEDKDALTTGQNNGLPSPRKSKVVDKDLDDVANLLGGLSVQTKQCDVCQLQLTKAEVAMNAIRCSNCECDLIAFKDNTKVRKRCKDPSGTSTKAKYQANMVKRYARPIVNDSDDEGEDDEGNGEWVVAGPQRHNPNLGKAGGSEDENAEGGGEWLVSDDSDRGDDSSVQVLGSHRKEVIRLDNSSDDSESSSYVTDEEEDPGDSGSDERAAVSMVTSTKIQYLLRILRKESRNHKFIVFSQFTSMLNLIEPFLKKEGLVYTRYDGSMRNDHREASLERLRNEKRTRILLCSLKCGSLGLNLTAASRVVILEPFWNPFVEEQAIDRVHRLNQTVDVVVYKITIADSVEERILDLQEKKRALAEAAIEGKAVAKLSMQDILKLFRRDAEHDARHETYPGLSVKTRVLPNAGAPDLTEGRRATPPALVNGKGKSGLKEDAVYGRRW